MKPKPEGSVNSDVTPSSSNCNISDISNCFDENENLSPTAITLLPKDLLDSPMFSSQYGLQSSFLPSPCKNEHTYYEVPIMHLRLEDNNVQIRILDDNNGIITGAYATTNTTNYVNEGSDTCFKGFYLKTTRSNVKFVIEDPYIIEHVILLPITRSFILSVKKWGCELNNDQLKYIHVNTTTDSSISSTTDPCLPSLPLSQSSSSFCQCKLIHIKSVLVKLYEDYIETYGYLKHAKLFVKYALRDFPECEEKKSLLKLLKSKKLPISLTNYSNETPHEHENEITTCNDHNVPNCLSHFATDSFNYQSLSVQPSSEEKFFNYSLSTGKDHSLSKVNSFQFNDSIQTNISKNCFGWKKYRKILSSDSKNKNLNQFNILYKSQICKHFQESGGCCPVGVKCHFAHGREELRDPKTHPKFRSQLCWYYSTTGYCFYGDRCYFRHCVINPPALLTSKETTPEVVKHNKNVSPDSTNRKNEHLVKFGRKNTKKNRLQDDCSLGLKLEGD
ncbi:unnamed protein product [Heterobilharzia americana]|nr:unnamed protein product [Heterobilharzia americana]